MKKLTEVRRKKRSPKVTYTTGCPALNIKHFNTRMGTNFDDDEQKENDKIVSEVVAEVNSEVNGTAGGGSTGGEVASETAGEATDTGGDGAGEGASMGESLNKEKLTEDRVLVGKLGKYLDLPSHIKLLAKANVMSLISKIRPTERFRVGYITPLYFYADLWDKFRLVKCTEMEGTTGEDYHYVNTDTDPKAVADRIDIAKDQIAHPEKYGTFIHYELTNKTIKRYKRKAEDNDPSAETTDMGSKVLNLSTILFYPVSDKPAKVTFYIDLLDGSGFFEVDQNMLETTIFKQLGKLADSDDGKKVIGGSYWTEQTLSDKINSVLDINKQTQNNKVILNLSNVTKPGVRALYTNQIYYMFVPGVEVLGQPLMEDTKFEVKEPLTEAKRNVRRYYIRPQNIFCANKADVIKSLIDIGDANCSVYTLKYLGDEKDVTKLTSKDIIYYYDNGILYDKNRVKVMDYDLYIKHEEERKKFAGDIDDVADSVVKDEYSDRLIDLSMEEDYNPFALNFKPINVFGEAVEHGGICCICGEEYVGYGNNPEPYKHNGKCCDACNLKFVIPARLLGNYSAEETEENIEDSEEE